MWLFQRARHESLFETIDKTWRSPQEKSRGRHVLIRQRWNDEEDAAPESLLMGVLRCFTSCCAPQAVDSADDNLSQTELAEQQCQPTGGREVESLPRPGSKRPPVREEAPKSITRFGENARAGKFQRVRDDGPWWVARSSQGGKLFWMHEATEEITWKQPLPHTKLLPSNINVEVGMRQWAKVRLPSRALSDMPSPPPLSIRA